MRVIIREETDSASRYAAKYIINRINAFAPTPERPFVLGLPTGSSPEIIYKYLVQAHKAGEISFANVVTFNMDEYVGIPEDHPESYHSFMYKHFFAHVDINPANVNILNGNAPSLAAECANYEARITKAGGIDLFLGGIGPDGHIAFNEPGSSLTSRTRVKTLAEDTIRANSRFFGGDLSQVPKQALTVGVGTVMDAREVLVIVLGANKALALAKTIEGGISQMWTASALQMHEQAMIVCDDAATDEMLVKTVKYFKSIEHIAAEEETGKATPQQHLPTKTENWRNVLKDLKIDTDKKGQAEQEDGELTPDSMSSRLVDSAIGLNDKKTDDFMFDKMGSRVSTFTT
ncbi:Glucosamine-6-phosphate isomerase (Glucosamine-6-phosphate deaminase) (GNPDA) (GlcN6P deaminase) [Exophiala xenobiotica]|uniref:Glucosamine-6-phosphate isomerase n=1 Tax=Vermiconidia calcicola TaxID=1690605 RepID=A0AAV9QCS7_9PEZI|nr:Glucosamine-6-phosphate isomerase (Glucosamine-6-phosphate deaminase) (GNPDA) (GlcN6P deaminase) [Exophiala xenobiotica]KAK5535619.1 Glucosamine-6-phosphate isomerase (Glucosamine-6-phosphate deaminase) (GNPDA) (GlcN6P deaminase) [Chaetothyriales sp. CCFEE 6169]KAK5537681.1 Glucosamine-6-phosphate isomerase (Glucosamine-6-phosphate deaminase) (GNPDA) (GlcN6P deaminase) [Vermiconidia calcicola]KAK5219107.1 Glucosamine-6-phosphate isomerase (Glucosamine-6-phosphate deaminase) (GNPDA) (GlcN6P de